MKRVSAWAIDLVLVLAATLLAKLLRRNFDMTLQEAQAFAPYLAMTMGAAMVVIPLLGLNKAVWRFSSSADYATIAAASMLIVMLALVGTFTLNRMAGVSRALPLLHAMMIFLLLSSARSFMQWKHRHRRPKPKQLTDLPAPLQPAHVLVVGINRLSELYLRAAEELGPDHVRVAGLLGHLEGQTGRLMLRYPVLGAVEQVADVLRDLEIRGVSVDRLVVAGSWMSLAETARTALRDVEAASNIRVMFLTDALGLAPSRSADAEPKRPRLTAEPSPLQPGSHRMGAVSGPDPMLTVTDQERAALLNNPYWFWKRVLDVIGALALIVLSAPLMGVVCLVALIDVGRPVLFWQQRPGLGGHPFRVYKVRTLRRAHDHTGARVPDDERSSTVGRFLRATRLDELPQLLAILTGRMSFIGPRPLLPIDQPLGSEARLLVRPGLTGWAQVNGGRALSPIEKAKLDVWYLRHASLRLDLLIVWRTMAVILRGEGGVANPDAETPSQPLLRS